MTKFLLMQIVPSICQVVVFGARSIFSWLKELLKNASAPYGKLSSMMRTSNNENTNSKTHYTEMVMYYGMKYLSQDHTIHHHLG